jgi:hypothetical protein
MTETNSAPNNPGRAAGNGSLPRSGREAALYFLDRGRAPVPVVLGARYPKGIPGWETGPVTPENVDEFFPAGVEKGCALLPGEPSHGLADVDGDCDEAIRAGRILLPATGWTSGRQSHPDAHRWYQVSPGTLSKAAERFYDPTVPRKTGDDDHAGLLIELRSTGSCTLAFSPRHFRKNEPVTFSFAGEPGTVDAAPLRTAVQKTAAAALLGRHWPQGARHDAALALAGGRARLTASGAVRSTLSRVGPAGMDYTGRPNKLAHHLILDPGERPAAGPAWLLGRPGLFQSTWDRQVGWRETAPVLPDRPPPAPPCRAWERVAGDAGWAGVLAEAFVADPRRLAVLVFAPGTDMLALIGEALLLLPPPRHWDVTFTTYFTALPPAAECLWRGVVAGTPAAKAATRLPGVFIIDLTVPLIEAVGGPLVEVARTGRSPVRAAATEAPAPAAVSWDLSRPAAGPSPASQLDGSAWPNTGPNRPPPQPRLRPPPPPAFAVPVQRRKMAVWLVPLAVLIGGASVGGVLTLMPPKVSERDQVYAGAKPALPTLPSKLALPAPPREVWEDVLAGLSRPPSGVGLADAWPIAVQYWPPLQPAPARPILRRGRRRE